MAKKFLLELQPEPASYTFLGISCHLQDYRLSYLLNLHLNLRLIKKDDLCTRSFNQKNEAAFSFYQYGDEDNFYSCFLLSNRSEAFILVPEMKQVDYMMIVDGEFKKAAKEQMLHGIRSIPQVLTSYEVKVSDIRNNASLLSDLEMHITYINRAEKLVYQPKTLQATARKISDHS